MEKQLKIEVLSWNKFKRYVLKDWAFKAKKQRGVAEALASFGFRRICTLIFDNSYSFAVEVNDIAKDFALLGYHDFVYGGGYAKDGEVHCEVFGRK